MAKITFITGGARSGKSRIAQKRAEELASNPLYLATAHIWDEDFEKRVNRHKADRGENWSCVEEERFLASHDFTGKVVVLDCITLWLNNIFYANNYDIDLSLTEAQQEWKKLITQEFTLLVVSNELGMGVHPENEAARKFADLQGWVNQMIAADADEVMLMVSGIEVKIKG